MKKPKTKKPSKLTKPKKTTRPPKVTMPSLSLTPSQIRAQILDDHKQLKKKLSTLQKLAKTSKSTAANAKLLATTEDFIESFLKHLLVEEAVLRPVLEDIDAWGPVRVDRMDKEHRTQRARIGHIHDLVRRKRYDTLRKELEAFVEDFVSDIRNEEKEILHADLLRDDVITIGLVAG